MSTQYKLYNFQLPDGLELDDVSVSLENDIEAEVFYKGIVQLTVVEDEEDDTPSPPPVMLNCESGLTLTPHGWEGSDL